MRSICLSAVAVLMMSLLMFSGVMAEEATGPWFDMEHCGFCKTLLDQPELMEHMTWEQHNISNGIMSVTTVDPEFMPQYQKASAAMEEVGKKFAAGEKVEMCPMCQAMGACYAKGMKTETVKTLHGDVTLMTSDDPALVAEIQAWGKRTNDEMAKMEAEPMEKMEKE
jgi:hypothetical protein